MLVEKLNGVCRRALEEAAALCVAQTHYAVDVEHLLLSLLAVARSDAAMLVDAAAATEQLQRAVERLPRGNSGTPGFAPRLLQLLREAWLEASLDLEWPAIRSAAIVMALGDSCPALPRVPRESLRERIRDSVEEEGRAGAPAMRTNAAAPLERFTIDLLSEARAGRIDPIRGRDVEIGQVIDILTRRRQNNPILVGDAGVGKTAVVEGFALRIVAGDVPPALRGISLRTLDLGLLQAGAGVKGEFEERLESVIAEVKSAAQPVVLFVDEAHTLIGAGNQPGQGDAANLLKPALARGELRTIAATTWSEYKKYFEKDPALTRRFQLVKVEEPDERAALDMLRGVAPQLEKHHGVQILDEAVCGAVRLSHRYLPERRLPDKAIGVLDTAAARVALQGEEPLACDARAVAAVISGWTGIPVGHMLADEVRGILTLKERLAERVVGQPQALDAICRRISTSRAGLEDPAKPKGVFLLCGPTGVGKTETALALADALYGGERNLIAFNMSEFSEPHSVATLKGAPPGYVGYGRGGALTEAVRRRPWSAVLLDEIEKAHPDVVDLFYQVFDKGVLEDGEGVPVDFRHTLFLLTSNAGPEQFRPSLLARLTVVPYAPLRRADLTRIVELKLHSICRRVREHHGAELTYDAGLIESLASHCEPSSGAREVDRILTQAFLPELSTRILERMAAGAGFTTIHVSVDAQGRFV